MASLDEEFDALPDAPANLDAEFDAIPDAAPAKERGFFDRLKTADERARKEAGSGLAGVLSPTAMASRALQRGGILLEEFGAESVGQTVQDFARGGVQGSTLGFADEIDAAADAAAGRVLEGGQRKLSDVVTGRDPSLLGRYRSARDAERTANAAASERSPWASGIGEFAGGVTLPIPGGTGWKEVVKQGAKLGAGYGLGKSDADLTQGEVVGAAFDTAVGAGAGALGGVVGKGLGDGLGYVYDKAVRPGLQKLSGAAQDAVYDFAAKRALKASGYIQKDIKPIARKDPQQVLDKGKALLAEPGVITPGATVDDIAARLEPAVNKYGQQIGDILNMADSAGGRFDMRRFVDRARREIIDGFKVNGQLDPAVAGQVKALDDLLAQYEAMGNTGFASANQLKSNLQSTVNWGNNWNDAKANIPNDLKTQLQRILLDEVDDQLGQSLGGRGGRVRMLFKDAKQKYGAMVDALDKARMGVARETGNDFVGIKDKVIGSAVAGGGIVPSLMAGSPEMAIGSALLGGAVSLGNKLVRERGSAFVASAARGTGGVVAKLRAALNSQPQLMGRFAPLLQRAAMQGERQFSATHFVLAQKEPEYRQMLERIADQPPPQDEPVAAR